MSDKERKIVSYHEVGHALVSALQKNTEPVQKITIVPRTMGALGYTLQTPEEEKYLETKDELLAKITTFMAGRAAEVLVFHSATSGAANDIENATKIARAMVTMYGMSDTFGMMCLATVENQYLDGRAGLICGEDTAGQIDKEVLSIINNSYNEAMQMLTENREILDHISEYLYEKETITGKEFMKIFREMKGLPQEEDKEALMPDDTEKDKKDSKAAFVSDDMFEDYVFPQENGSHYNCQYASVGNLFAKGKKPFSFQASRYSEKELDDYKQSGIGSNSCGPRLAEKYQLREEKIEWEISIRFGNKN